MESIRKASRYGALENELTIDCDACAGLCCAALYFAKSEGFPADKPAGKPCANLTKEFRCAIHGELRARGMKGCTAYDCFGVGQRVTRDIYPGRDWRSNPELAEQMFSVFTVVRQLHQMLWYLLEASSLLTSEGLEREIDDLVAECALLLRRRPEQLLAFDPEGYRAKVNRVLKEAGDRVRAAVNPTETGKAKLFLGKDFKGANLEGRDFSMSLLIAAKLGGCRLFGANLLGADLRDADVRNADLSGCVFLTQIQVNSAKGNRETKLPPNLTRPTAWS